jgi:hypothetical protein
LVSNKIDENFKRTKTSTLFLWTSFFLKNPSSLYNNCTTTYWPASPDDKQELKKGNSFGEGRDKTYSGVCKLILFTILKSDTICIYEIQQRTRVKRAMKKTSDRICHPFWAFWILHSPPPTTKYDYSTNAWMSLFLIERWRANQFESQISGSHG